MTLAVLLAISASKGLESTIGAFVPRSNLGDEAHRPLCGEVLEQTMNSHTQRRSEQCLMSLPRTFQDMTNDKSPWGYTPKSLVTNVIHCRNTRNNQSVSADSPHMLVERVNVAKPFLRRPKSLP